MGKPKNTVAPWYINPHAFYAYHRDQPSRACCISLSTEDTKYTALVTAALKAIPPQSKDYLYSMRSSNSADCCGATCEISSTPKHRYVVRGYCEYHSPALLESQHQGTTYVAIMIVRHQGDNKYSVDIEEHKATKRNMPETGQKILKNWRSNHQKPAEMKLVIFCKTPGTDLCSPGYIHYEAFASSEHLTPEFVEVSEIPANLEGLEEIQGLCQKSGQNFFTFITKLRDMHMQYMGVESLGMILPRCFEFELLGRNLLAHIHDPCHPFSRDNLSLYAKIDSAVKCNLINDTDKGIKKAEKLCGKWGVRDFSSFIEESASMFKECSLLQPNFPHYWRFLKYACDISMEQSQQHVPNVAPAISPEAFYFDKYQELESMLSDGSIDTERGLEKMRELCDTWKVNFEHFINRSISTPTQHLFLQNNFPNSLNFISYLQKHSQAKLALGQIEEDPKISADSLGLAKIKSIIAHPQFRGGITLPEDIGSLNDLVKYFDDISREEGLESVERRFPKISKIFTLHRTKTTDIPNANAVEDNKIPTIMDSTTSSNNTGLVEIGSWWGSSGKAMPPNSCANGACSLNNDDLGQNYNNDVVTHTGSQADGSPDNALSSPHLPLLAASARSK